MEQPMSKEVDGFSEEPFGLTPDPRFFFSTENLREVIDSLIYHIEKSDGFVLVTGEIGVGKTTLIQQLLPMLSPAIQAVPIYQPAETFDGLMEAILKELRLPLHGKNGSSMTSQLNDYLSQKSARNETVVIIFDEAHNLSKEVMEDLRLLCNPDPRQPRRLKEVFVGRPQIEEKLRSVDMRQLNQRITARHQVRPLTEEESWRYIAYRLNKVNQNAAEIFTSGAVSSICNYAKGIPRIINMTCHLALSARYVLGEKKIDWGIIKEVFAILESQNPSRWQRMMASLEASTDRVGRSSVITKISVLLWVYCVLAWITFFYLSLQK
jgi:general secretion pathway protein A